MSLPKGHRVVTGHDESGAAIISSRGQLPVVREPDAVPGLIFHEIGNTSGAPAPMEKAGDPKPGDITLILDDSEVDMTAGCILIDGSFDPVIKNVLEQRRGA
ncbi:MAG: hypothetical protein OXC05_12965 [Halieaceae bacterium]|nr:hypothetical protein [Halieaceae bacterium]